MIYYFRVNASYILVEQSFVLIKMITQYFATKFEFHERIVVSFYIIEFQCKLVELRNKIK